MPEIIKVNPDKTLTITRTSTVNEIVKLEDVKRAIADITIELGKVQARLDYQKSLLAKFT